MSGRGAYDHSQKLFECFKSASPWSLKIDFNADIARKTPGVTKLFEARYGAATGEIK